MLEPGIPNLPDLVAIIPFYWKPHETAREKTKVVITAEIDGRRGNFILDLGDVPTALNRTYLQPNAAGGVDTVTDSNRVADNTPRSNYLSGDLRPWDRAHVKVRLGTLVSTFDDPGLTKAVGESDPHRYNVILGHLWGDFGWVFAPRLGNIGPAVLESFETIIDYPRKRVILIRLDSAGHRMAEVPEYTQRWTTPLLPVPIRIEGLNYLGIKVRPDNTLDVHNAANNTETKVIDTGAPDDSDDDILGYPSLSRLGVFGINQRTHQFILYTKRPKAKTAG
jgi:hypothetical protein